MSNISNLNGIRGWLLVYLIVAGLGGLYQIVEALAIEDGFYLAVALPQFILVICATNFREPWIRTAHIILWAAYIAMILFFAISLAGYDPEYSAGAVGAAIGGSIWLLYWIKSKRVKVTYNVVSARDIELELLDE